MRAEVHHHSFVSSTEDPGIGKGGQTRANLDGDAASIVENAVLVSPSVGVPDPVSERAVDESSPKKHKDHSGNDSAALGNSTNGESGSDSAEHHLIERVEQSRDERRANRRSTPYFLKSKMLHVADEAVAGVTAEGERVSPKVPLKDDNGKRHHCDPEHGEGGFTTGESGVEEGDAGNHEKNEAGRDEDEGLISRLVPLV